MRAIHRREWMRQCSAHSAKTGHCHHLWWCPESIRQESSRRGRISFRPVHINASSNITYPPATIRECDSDMTCSEGVVLLKSQIVLQKADADSATALLSVSYQLDRQQVVRDSNTVVSITVPNEVPTLRGSERFERVVSLSYGERRRVSFPHGVDFYVCIAPGDKYMQPANGQCRLDDVAQGKAPRESVQAL